MKDTTCILYLWVYTKYGISTTSLSGSCLYAIFIAETTGGHPALPGATQGAGLVVAGIRRICRRVLQFQVLGAATDAVHSLVVFAAAARGVGLRRAVWLDCRAVRLRRALPVFPLGYQRLGECGDGAADSGLVCLARLSRAAAPEAPHPLESPADGAAPFLGHLCSGHAPGLPAGACRQSPRLGAGSPHVAVSGNPEWGCHQRHAQPVSGVLRGNSGADYP
ncbi:MAG: hypothetical protein BWY63_02849 [Chloroflexi bacterium ADurb.Bin360]|nr:MAG: hypothetical protein BWY63_02849 [Chloroflexi bacterium ADurb.Bin360]